MPLTESLAMLVSDPSPASLWQLRGDLLGEGVGPDARVLGVIAAFYDYLDRVQTGMSSRDYSHLASKLDISAISGVILERLVETRDSSEIATSILAGALSEGLMVLATRQHVRAWEGELSAVHRNAAWVLYDELWRWTAERSPEITPDHRATLIDAVLKPVMDHETPGLVRAVVICRLFQLMIASQVTQALEQALGV